MTPETKRVLAAFASGLLFGGGLTVSGMVNPAKVLNFLDITGAWDPSLLLVMGGALIVTFAGYRVIWKRSAPVLASQFQIPTRNDIDKRLVTGSVLFGLGWGLVGLCPGPALSALVIAGDPAVFFVLAMFVGMLLADQLFLPKSQPHRHKPHVHK